jgi:hypothetical protein
LPFPVGQSAEMHDARRHVQIRHVIPYIRRH